MAPMRLPLPLHSRDFACMDDQFLELNHPYALLGLAGLGCQRKYLSPDFYCTSRLTANNETMSKGMTCSNLISTARINKHNKRNNIAFAYFVVIWSHTVTSVELNS